MRFLRVGTGLGAGVLAVWLGAATGLKAQSPEDSYVRAFAIIEQADLLKGSGQARAAAGRYREAQAALQELRKAHPGWNERIISFREEYIASQLTALAATLPPSAPVAPGAVTTAPVQPGQAQPSAPAVAPKVPAGAGEGGAAAAVAALQAENARLADQNALLEAKLREALKVQPAAADPRELTKAQERIAALQKERDLLALSLEQARAQGTAPAAAAVAPATTSPAGGADTASLQREIERLRTRLVTLEIRAVPYTKEELALLGKGATSVAGEAAGTAPAAAPATAAAAPAATPAAAPAAAPAGANTNVTAAAAAGSTGTNVAASARRKLELPAGAGPLMRDAERAIDAGRLDEAERKLREILRQDENHPYVLARLAGVQMDQDKTADAEVSLKKALAGDPDDGMCLYLLGSLRLRQEKFDEAVDYLGKAVQQRPDYADAHFFLGQALLQKGLRPAAEGSLRRAIQLKPGWGQAHYVLAVFYATSEPAFKGLAQFHYKKAIVGGVSRNLDLERTIENLGTGGGRR